MGIRVWQHHDLGGLEGTSEFGIITNLRFTTPSRSEKGREKKERVEERSPSIHPISLPPYMHSPSLTPSLEHMRYEFSPASCLLTNKCWHIHVENREEVGAKGLRVVHADAMGKSNLRNPTTLIERVHDRKEFGRGVVEAEHDPPSSRESKRLFVSLAFFVGVENTLPFLPPRHSPLSLAFRIPLSRTPFPYHVHGERDPRDPIAPHAWNSK